MKRIRTACLFVWSKVLEMYTKFQIAPYEFEKVSILGVDVYVNRQPSYDDLYIDVTNVTYDERLLLSIMDIYSRKYNVSIDPAYATSPCGYFSEEDIMRMQTYFSQ